MDRKTPTDSAIKSVVYGTFVIIAFSIYSNYIN